MDFCLQWFRYHWTTVTSWHFYSLPNKSNHRPPTKWPSAVDQIHSGTCFCLRGVMEDFFLLSEQKAQTIRRLKSIQTKNKRNANLKRFLTCQFCLQLCEGVPLVLKHSTNYQPPPSKLQIPTFYSPFLSGPILCYHLSVILSMRLCSIVLADSTGKFLFFFSYFNIRIFYLFIKIRASV